MPHPPDFDSPWKDILEACFRGFVDLFLPQAAADIDWSKPPVFLEKEVPRSLSQSLRGVADLTRLKTFVREAASAQSLSRFEAGLKNSHASARPKVRRAASPGTRRR